MGEPGSGGALGMAATGGQGGTGGQIIREGSGGALGSGGARGSGGAGGNVPDFPYGFRAGVRYPVGAPPVAVAVGDVNGDGKPDVVVGTSDKADVRVLMNRGDGTLGVAVAYPSSGSVTSLALAELNGDGQLDIVVSSGSAVGVFTNQGDGTFATVSTYSVGVAIGSVAVGDLDGDGKPDIAVAESSQTCAVGVVGALFNRGDGTFAAPIAIRLGACAGLMALGDLNNDGKSDIVVTTTGRTTAVLNLGDRVFGDPLPGSGNVFAFGASSIAIGDVDADGNLDIVDAWRGKDSGPGFAQVLLGLGTGALVPGTSTGAGAPIDPLLTAGPPGTGPDAIALGDFNGDGRLDLAAANSGGTFAPGNVSVLLNVGNGTFGGPMSYSVGPHFRGLAIGDLDDDGKPDIVTTNPAGGDVTVLLNDFP